MGELLNKLIELDRSDVYPFHMPGHKRNKAYPFFREAFSLDITEIEGFGDLYSDEGILEDLKKRAARIYGARRAFILVNGSTVGVLSAISAAVSRRGSILMGENAHRSAFNAVYLNELKKSILHPPIVAPYMINGGISPENVERALNKDPEIEAVFITSPSYEGIISDIAGIAKVCHEKDKLLIVDSAHGAHLGFETDCSLEYNAQNAVSCGADIIIESLHKTLPSFTQTALLFVNSEKVDEECLKRYVSIYQTSSPSYLFMAGISACLDFLEKEGEHFKTTIAELKKTRKVLSCLENINIAGTELMGKDGIFGIDPYKLVIAHKKMSGKELYRILSDKYGLICELNTDRYILALSSPMDTKEGFERLRTAILEINGA